MYEKIKCLICGKKCYGVGSHVYMAHGMRAYDYKKKFGLRTTKGIISKNKMNYLSGMAECRSAISRIGDARKKGEFKKGDPRIIKRVKKFPDITFACKHCGKLKTIRYFDTRNQFCSRSCAMYVRHANNRLKKKNEEGKKIDS